jgi:hypothetical protein
MADRPKGVGINADEFLRGLLKKDINIGDSISASAFPNLSYENPCLSKRQKIESTIH